MALLDLLGRRWALRVMWELRGEPLTFRALRERCDDVSPSVLNERLGELREAGIVDAGEGGYALTGDGRRLGRKLAPLEAWANDWEKRARRG
jgi:DNA-binding HxlR family transcriptional regulator